MSPNPPSPPPPPTPPAASVPQEVPPHLDGAFQKQVAGWLQNPSGAPANSDVLLGDLREAAAKLDEQRQALAKLQQEAQQRQGEVAGLDGQMQACLRMLYRQQVKPAAPEGE